MSKFSWTSLARAFITLRTSCLHALDTCNILKRTAISKKEKKKKLFPHTHWWRLLFVITFLCLCQVEAHCKLAGFVKEKVSWCSGFTPYHWERERNVLFNDALNTFYLWLYGVSLTIKAILEIDFTLYNTEPLGHISFKTGHKLPSGFDLTPAIADIWYDKNNGMYSPVCGMVPIKEPLLLIRTGPPPPPSVSYWVYSYKNVSKWRKFYLMMCLVHFIYSYMVSDHSDSEREKLLLLVIRPGQVRVFNMHVQSKLL